MIGAPEWQTARQMRALPAPLAVTPVLKRDIITAGMSHAASRRCHELGPCTP